MVDSVDVTQLKLIDFGISSPYLKADGSHIDFGKAKYNGNILFSSVHMMQGLTLGRRDDLISLAYLMIFMVEGNMFFLVDDETKVHDFDYMRKCKTESTPETLCRTRSREFFEFV